MEKKSALFIALALALGFGAAAQGTEADTVFAPYPSRLRVGVREDLVLISWEDSPDLSSGYVIFRHSAEPSADNFADAVMIGDADSGSPAFEYRPPDDSPYYYFVLGRSESGVYEVFIPLRNASLAPIRAEAAASRPATTTPGTAAPSAAPQPSAVPVAGVTARVEGDAVRIGYVADASLGRLVLYRGTAPFKDAQALLSATIAAVLSAGSSDYVDYPIPGIEYYYAIVPERELLGGRLGVEPGRNATQSPVLIPAGLYRVGLPSSTSYARSAPLPFLVLTRRVTDADPLIREDLAPQARPVSAATEKAIASLVASAGLAPSFSRPAITIFPEDLKTSPSSDFSLYTISAGSLARGNYDQAARELNLYLSLPRSPAATARARFYRGQALAMTGAWREAFFELLRAEDSHYLAVQPWLDYVLFKLSSGL
jgi:hypothetical protein